MKNDLPRRNAAERWQVYGKAPFQAESARGAVDHLKIIGGMAIYRQESAAGAIRKHYGVDRG